MKINLEGRGSPIKQLINNSFPVLNIVKAFYYSLKRPISLKSLQKTKEVFFRISSLWRSWWFYRAIISINGMYIIFFFKHVQKEKKSILGLYRNTHLSTYKFYWNLVNKPIVHSLSLFYSVFVYFRWSSTHRNELVKRDTLMHYAFNWLT